jgi:hypothetical protein
VGDAAGERALTYSTAAPLATEAASALSPYFGEERRLGKGSQEQWQSGNVSELLAPGDCDLTLNRFTIGSTSLG